MQASPAGELKPAESSIKGCAEKLINAVHEKNADAVAEALNEAFAALDKDDEA